MSLEDIRLSSGSSPEVGIVILNYNNYKDTKHCLSSLEELEYPNYRVIVVDNGSTDGSAERLASEFGQHEFLCNDRNLGFAAGNKVAVEQLLEEDVDYILLLNNDTVVTDDFLTPLVETAETNERVGLVGGLLSYYDESTDEYWYAGGQISPYVVELTTETKPKSDVPHETGYCSGALMLISAEFADNVDILREEYFFGRDQLDISWRARANGWKVMLDPRSEVEHKVSATVGGQSPFKVYYDMRGRLFFASQNLSLFHSIIFHFFFIVTRPIIFGKWLLQGKTGRIRAHLIAVMDFLRGQYPIREFSHEE